MDKKVSLSTKIFGVISVVSLIMFLILVLNYYWLFIIHVSSFDLIANNNETIVTNDIFNIKFKISQKCSLDTEPTNYLLRQRIYGQFRCSDKSTYLKFSVYPNAVFTPQEWIDFKKETEDTRKIEGYDRVYVTYEKDKIDNIKIYTDSGESSMFLHGSLQIMEQVFESLEEL